MRLFINILFGIMVLIFTSCASTNTTVSESNQKAFDAIVSGESYEIISSWAEPQVTGAWSRIANAGILGPGNSAGMINITGHVNYIRKKGDTISGYLPFYGERQMGGGYASKTTGIEFEGIPKDYQITEGKKQSYEIRFSISDKNHSTENYTVYIRFFPNLSCATTVQSSQRFSIGYQGKISILDKE